MAFFEDNRGENPGECGGIRLLEGLSGRMCFFDETIAEISRNIFVGNRTLVNIYFVYLDIKKVYAIYPVASQWHVQ